MRKLLNILYNFHWIAYGEAARSAQAYAGLLGPFLKANRIAAVINLRGRHPKFGWWKYESQTCARLGIAHFDVMLDSKRLPLREMLVSLFEAFDAAERFETNAREIVTLPFLIKCSGGQDRTSFAAALYIVHRDGWPALERAQRQFARFPYLHFPKPPQRWLKQFLPYAKREANGKPIADWVRESYDPHEFAQTLAPGTFNGIWEPWKPPPSR